ncbi:MAG: GNAT family N-acetyltransferase [Nocardioides sp.]|nr:GNAT family N-acetyltransferase [Nocardioides sp.]
MTDSIRALTLADYPEALRLGAEAFGPPPPGAVPEAPDVWPPNGLHSSGTFRGGRMAAKMSARELASWFDGVEVPTSGISSVTVAAEHRGEGLLTDLFGRLLSESRERGEVISTLYPTAPGIYRKFGYEIVGTLRQVEIPTAQLSGVQPVEGLWTRRATTDDVPAVTATYTAWAREQSGPITRTTALFDPGDVLRENRSVTLVVDAEDTVRGYAVWTRGAGYDAASTLDVEDLVALDAEANRALWRMLGSWASVTGAVRLWTSGDDVTRLSLPTRAWSEVKTNSYMLRLLDVPGAFALRSAPEGLAADLPFRVEGDRTGMIDGSYRLDVEHGAVGCTTAGPAGRSYTPQGIALAWSGAQSSADIRRAGHLTGPTTDDRIWDALFGCAQIHVRDYF